MEDLVGEESADWGLLLGPAVQACTNAEHDNVDLPGSHRHDQELRATVGLANHGGRGHESDFSTLLDGLEEDLGVSTGVDPVPAPSGVLPEVHRERVVPPRSGRLGPRFTRRHTAVHPEQVRSLG